MYNKLIEDVLYGSKVNRVYIISIAFISEIIDSAFKKLVFRNLRRDKLKE